MTYNIIFLGTGGGRSVMADQSRATGGIVFNFGKTQMHLDPGPGSLVRAREYNVDVTRNDIVLISHTHIDHNNDLNAIIDAMTIGGENKRGSLITTKVVVNGNDKHVPILSSYHRNCLKDVFILEAGKQVKMNNIIIKGLRTFNHGGDNIGFKFFTNEFVLSYTSDTDYSKDLAIEHKGSDVIIVNNQRTEAKRLKGYMDSDKTIKLLQEVKPKLAIITHFSRVMLDANPIYEAREIQKKSGIQVVAAQDGMIIDPLSYSATLRQKILGSYS